MLVIEYFEPNPCTLPRAPVGPGTVESSPLLPLGIVKFSIAAEVVPLLVTETLVPAAPVLTVPRAIVAAVPAGPTGPNLTDLASPPTVAKLLST